MTDLVLGTKQHVIIELTDRLNEMTTLDGANARFDFRRRGQETYEQQNLTVTNLGMRAFCLIDTTGWDRTKAGTYELFLYFNAFPEVPRLGPFEFGVNA